jgi:hypothetical protein
VAYLRLWQPIQTGQQSRSSFFCKRNQRLVCFSIIVLSDSFFPKNQVNRHKAFGYKYTGRIQGAFISPSRQRLIRQIMTQVTSTLGTSDINYYSVSTAGTVGGKYPLLSIDGADGNCGQVSATRDFYETNLHWLCCYDDVRAIMAASMNQLIDVDICRIS